jgi:Thiamine pyrophosphate enzyme, C-terminal TPP binding domain
MSRGLVSLVGDGIFMFSVAAAAFWVARRYGTSALTVIYDNRGWRAPKQPTLGMHPSGAAAATDDFNVSFDPEADLPVVAAARRRVRRDRVRPGGAARRAEGSAGRGALRPRGRGGVAHSQDTGAW